MHAWHTTNSEVEHPGDIVEFPMFWLIEKVDFMPNLLLATFVYTAVYIISLLLLRTRELEKQSLGTKELASVSWHYNPLT